MPELAERTGQYVLCIWETTDYLLAIHGPYGTAEEARSHLAEAEGHTIAKRGGHADVLPLWHPAHVGRA